MSKPAQFGIIAAAVLVIALAGWFALKAVPESGEPSADLRAKQIEYQRSLIPGGGGANPAGGSNPAGGPPPGAMGGKPAYVDQAPGGKSGG